VVCRDPKLGQNGFMACHSDRKSETARVMVSSESIIEEPDRGKQRLTLSEEGPLSMKVFEGGYNGAGNK